MQGHAEKQTSQPEPNYVIEVFDGTYDYKQHLKSSSAESHVLTEPQGLLGSFVLLNLMSERTADRIRAWRKTKPLKRILAVVKAARAEYKNDLKRNDLPLEKLIDESAPTSDIEKPFVIGIETGPAHTSRETLDNPMPQTVSAAPISQPADEQSLSLYGNFEHTHQNTLSDEDAEIIAMAARRARKALNGKYALDESDPHAAATKYRPTPTPESTKTIGRHRADEPKHARDDLGLAA